MSSSFRPAFGYPRLLSLWLAIVSLAPLLITSQISAQTLSQRWLQISTEPSFAGYNEGHAVEVGPDGHAVMAGTSNYSSDFTHIRTTKYHGSTGAIIWSQGSRALNRGDVARGFTLDSLGNAIVVGFRRTFSSGSNTFYAAKYAAADGALMWERVMPDRGYFLAVKVDADGDVVATGTTRLNLTSPIESDILTYKFDGTTGETLWRQQFSMKGSGWPTGDGGYALAIDAEGNVFVTGFGYFSHNPEATTLKIAGSDGRLLWSRQRSDSVPEGSSGQDIGIDAEGNALVISSALTPGGGYRVIKYGTDGTELWVDIQMQFGTPSSLAIDPRGDVVVTGYIGNRDTHNDIFTSKVDGSSGSILWTSIYDGGIVGQGLRKDDQGMSVRFDQSGNPVVAGVSNASTGDGPETIVLKYSGSTGTTLIAHRISIAGTSNYPRSRDALTVGAGHITVTGRADRRGIAEAFVVRLNDPAPPTVTNLPATGVQGDSAELHGTVNPNGSPTSAVFSYGPSPGEMSTTTSPQGLGDGFASVPVSATLTGLFPSTTYYYQLTAESNGRSEMSEIRSFKFAAPSDNALLASLDLSTGSLFPDFDAQTTSYVASVPFESTGVAVIPGTDHPGATVEVNGTPVTSGTPGEIIPITEGNTTITVKVTAEDGTATQTYTITVTRLPESFVFQSAMDVPVTANGFSAGSYPAEFTLNYPPTPGTVLTVINNTGLEFIGGRFESLAQGQPVTLNHGGNNYDFVANYYGGSGNDLVLQWTDTQLMGWGARDQGQLGKTSARNHALEPLPLDPGIEFAGRPLISTATGYLHSLCLFADGTIVSWGHNIYGQLGQAAPSPDGSPAAVAKSDALAGKTVVAVTAGAFHSLALCSDGTVAAWGYNNHGQLGNGKTTSAAEPVSVDASGALAGKTVVAIAAGAYHSLAICSNGTVAAWGFNETGTLGDGSIISTRVPVLATGALVGKMAVAIATGDYHNIALCSDGTLTAWGYNSKGQLGNGTTQSSLVPMAVNSSGALSGKTIKMIGAGAYHSLALSSDGMLAAWGSGSSGQLGNGNTINTPTPLPVDLPAEMSGVFVAISGGAEHSYGQLSSGRILAWGGNSNGQIGNGTTTSQPTPTTEISTVSHPPVLHISRGSSSTHMLAIVAGAGEAGGMIANASPGLIAHETPSPGEGSLHEQAWKQYHFGKTAATGVAADLADPDGDGVVNLIEYAFNTDPNTPNQLGLPQWRREGEALVLRFTKWAGVTGLRYQVLSGEDPEKGPWQPLENSAVEPDYLFRVPFDQPRCFMRIEVKRF